MSIDINAGCGPHCGIAAGREGHCDCVLCHDGAVPVVITREDLTAELRGTPMCARWYELAGEYRPWQARAWQCRCGVSPHALPEQHGKHCPVYRFWHGRRQAADVSGEPVTP